MGKINFEQLTNHNILVRTVHSAVKGRARYKVHGLYGSEALKRYLGYRLSKEDGIVQVSANTWTGNVLVMFRPDFSPSAIALLLQNIVQDYAKEVRKLALETTNTSKGREQVKNAAKVPSKLQLSQINNQLILASGAICTLSLGAVLLHRNALDESILLAIQQLHTPILDSIMVGITQLGNPLALVLICLGVESYLLYYRRRQATRLGLATASAIGLNYGLKVLFGRARPELWDRLILVGHHSFPSGHAMVSMVIYGFISYIFAEQFPQWQRQIYAITTVLILAIGFSRLYLGVHWPTDVLAGYAIGLAWLIVCILTLELQPKYTALINNNFKSLTVDGSQLMVNSQQ
ncbi:phosphatase PAP2 family protein [Tolypothrix sp. PCC 7910]|uniref:phosphatase PAP2 family protein n=1 Tax=Tolypothrix sp. PCC 7910 TaxID=2099387 RepID=UPI0014276FDE|nr:phosphatase PAP2 family protein [Tolypothrix sp. PCC 7910]QIR37086.1 phosphatase PAP2 family protein [Tolypothrix sp. PCC 7910]